MKHLKKFESTNNKNFNISEISDIIGEFADSFEVEEEDIDISYYWNGDQFIPLNDLRDDPNSLKHIEDLLEINIPRSEIEHDDFIQEFPNQQLAADHLGVKKQAIWNVLNGYINKKSGNQITQVKGFKFIYKT